MNFFPMTTRKRFYFHFYSLCVLAILLIRSFAFLTKLMTMMMPIVLFVFTLLWWTWWGPWTWWWTWWVARCQWTLRCLWWLQLNPTPGQKKMDGCFCVWWKQKTPMHQILLLNHLLGYFRSSLAIDEIQTMGICCQ